VDSGEHTDGWSGGLARGSGEASSERAWARRGAVRQTIPPRPPSADAGARAVVYTCATFLHPPNEDPWPTSPSRLKIHRNATPSFLYEAALRFEKGSAISSTGSLIAYSGKKTGRSPTDKRVVDEPEVRDDVWWGSVNIKLDAQSFTINRERAIDYLNTKERLYVVDGYAGWDPAYRLKIRIICARAYHALFMRNMLIRPTAEELETFGEPDYVIFNAGGFPANKHTAGMTSSTSIDLSFGRREFVILGSEYAGEMKKGVFTIMNYLMPKRGVLSMHCSATQARDGSDTSVLFGLSGTGKTTLSADPKRLLIGDDEHCWSDTGVFNIEGGCYAKVIDLSKEQEPDIWNALQFGSVLENVVFDPESHVVDYTTCRSPRTPAAATRSTSSPTPSCRRSPGTRRTSSS
jgi:phosphoenolpyruvate carboxykinase (ATP)